MKKKVEKVVFFEDKNKGIVKKDENKDNKDKNLDFEILLKKFKKMVNKTGILKDAHKHDEFLPKSLRRKIKDEEARRRNKS